MEPAKESKSGDEDHNRITWRNKFEFVFNVIGYNVGLGNIWRFSYLCFKDGGGAFLIPYLLSAVVIGVPILFVEVAIGQFTRHGCIAAWDIFPLMRGIGFAGMVLSFLVNIYFVVVMAWCVFYFFNSFTLEALKWTTCDNWWNTKRCMPIGSEGSQLYNTSATNYSSNLLPSNESSDAEEVSAPVEFFNNYVLQRSSGIDDFGGFTNWKMVGCFILSWIACYLCIYKGIRSSGKAAYVTVIAPYVLMLVMFVRGITLEGAGQGIEFYIKPNVTRLMEPMVWLDAGTQVIYSLGICFGCFYGMGSYNKFSFDCYKSAYLFVTTCCCSSFFFGFVLFSFLGHMAHVQGKNVTDIAEGGPGLVFVVLPNALSTLPAPQFWSAAFFLGMVFLAIDGVFTVVEGSVTALADYWPEYFGPRGTHVWRIAFCLVLMLISLPQFADNGIYIFEIINRYGSSGIALLWVALFEMTAVSWFYGIDRFWDNVKSMIGYYPSNIMKYCLKYLSPAFCLTIFIACCVEYTPLQLGNYVYPWWGDLLGWFLQLLSVLSIPVVAAITLYNSPGRTITEKWECATTSKIQVEDLQDDAELKNMISKI